MILFHKWWFGWSPGSLKTFNRTKKAQVCTPKTAQSSKTVSSFKPELGKTLTAESLVFFYHDIRTQRLLFHRSRLFFFLLRLEIKSSRKKKKPIRVFFLSWDLFSSTEDFFPARASNQTGDFWEAKNLVPPHPIIFWWQPSLKLSRSLLLSRSLSLSLSLALSRALSLIPTRAQRSTS